MNTVLVLSCEHAGNKVPASYRKLFEGKQTELATHHGYDIGAQALALTISKELKVSPFIHEVSRLLIDVNRSLHNPSVFSEYTKELSRESKEEIITHYYQFYRQKVTQYIDEKIQNRQPVLHIGVHTFTPVLNGKTRTADIGLLYDPARTAERFFCYGWKRELSTVLPDVSVRMNYPYRGISDGFTTTLREAYPEDYYIGIELEVNQRFVEAGVKEDWQRIQHNIAASLQTVITAGF